MGKHVAVYAPEGPIDVRARRQRPRTRRTIVLGLFSFLAAFGFVAVNIVDPYSGATASPYFDVAQTSEPTAAQSLVVAGDYETTVARDGYGTYVKPEPKPEPEEDEASDADETANDGDDDGGGDDEAPSAPSAPAPSPGSAKAVAHELVLAHGWGEDQYSCLVSLWDRESGWNVHAENPSGAYGIPQALPGSKMSSAGPDWQSNARTQITWGLEYISGRYGSPCSAWGHSQSTGWY